MKIGEIDTLKENYEADVMVKAKWREPALDKGTFNVSTTACRIFTCLMFTKKSRAR
jgi:hypothetical protein